MVASVQGTLMDCKVSQKGKRYLCIYNDSEIIRAFVADDDNKNYSEYLGKSVSIKVQINEYKFVRTAI